MSDQFRANNKTSASGTRTPRPTTPLRPSSRSSFRESVRGDGENAFPLDAFEPAFGELADAVTDLEANMMHFQLMHESLARFTESFASFLYGLNMNAFCVDFPEAPIPESFRRPRPSEVPQSFIPQPQDRYEDDGETSIMTTNTTFIDNPPTTVPGSTRARTSGQSRMPTSSRGNAQGRGRGRGRGKPSGLVQPRVRGAR